MHIYRNIIRQADDSHRGCPVTEWSSIRLNETQCGRAETGITKEVNSMHNLPITQALCAHSHRDLSRTARLGSKRSQGKSEICRSLTENQAKRKRRKIRIVSTTQNSGMKRLKRYAYRQSRRTRVYMYIHVITFTYIYVHINNIYMYIYIMYTRI